MEKRLNDLYDIEKEQTLMKKVKDILMNLYYFHLKTDDTWLRLIYNFLGHMKMLMIMLTWRLIMCQTLWPNSKNIKEK